MSITFIPPPTTGKRILERTLTIGQLFHSEHNCRQGEPTAEDTAPLEALILGQRLRVPIEVHADPDDPERLGVFAGRRRFYSIRRLIDRGDLPPDWLIPAREYAGYDDAELVELSLSENFRQDLEDHELAAGMARAHELGHDVEQIARNLGNLDAELVARWVRLGSLAPEVFEALTTGEIDLERAKAYAATEDRTLQVEVFERLRQSERLRQQASWHAQPFEIRRALTIGHEELHRRLLFVGEEAYRAAGGRYELDLFADDGAQRGRVVDEPILSDLVAAKLDALRAATRAELGRPELRFINMPPQNGVGGNDGTLEHRLKRVTGEAPTIPDGVVAHIAIGDAGAAVVTYWWPSNAAKHGGGRPGGASGRDLARIVGRPAEGAALSVSEMRGGGEARKLANTALRNEAGLTADLVEILRSQRRLIIRAALVERAREDRVDVGTGDAFLTWSQLRMLLGHGDTSITGAARFVAIGDPPVTSEYLRPLPGHALWRDAIAELQAQPFIAGEDPAAAFRAYLNSETDLQALAGAVACGLVLERTLDADGYRIAAQDVLAEQLGLTDPATVRRYWTPTAPLLARIPKDQRAAIAEPFVETASFAPWPRLGDTQLTENVLQVVTTGHPANREAQREAAARWVHPVLRFSATAAVAAEPEMVA